MVPVRDNGLYNRNRLSPISLQLFLPTFTTISIASDYFFFTNAFLFLTFCFSSGFEINLPFRFLSPIIFRI
jgi:hypothetical protein